VYNPAHLNQKPPTFTPNLPGLYEIKKSLNIATHLATADITYGYWNIKIHPEYRQYFGVNWNGHQLRWTVLPFGWNMSQSYFEIFSRPITKILKE
jgi:hypothetical protein